MSDNIIHMYPKGDIPVEVFDWFIRIEEGNLSQEETEELKLWVQENPDLAVYFSDVDFLWDRIGDASLETPSGLAGHGRNAAGKKLSWWNYGKYAGVAAAIVIMVLTALPFLPSSSVEKTRYYKTTTGERHIVALPDGSTLHMNSQTKITVKYTDKERLIDLDEGEAYFSVAKNPNRPFIVRSGALSVRALGTVFNVEHILGQKSAVTLVEGSIEVAQLKEDEIQASARLTQKGARASLLSTDNIAAGGHDEGQQSFNSGITLVQVNADNVISWREGKLVFSGEPLSLAIDKLNMHSQHKVILLGEEIGKEPVYGVFSMGDWKSAVRAIVSSYPLEAVEEGAYKTLLVAKGG